MPAQRRARQVPGQDDPPGGQLAERLARVAVVAPGERWAPGTGSGVGRLGCGRARGGGRGGTPGPDQRSGSGSGTSGSRNPTFRCTGPACAMPPRPRPTGRPAGDPTAAAIAIPAEARAARWAASGSSGSIRRAAPRSAKNRTVLPKNSTWSIVWGAPDPPGLHRPVSAEDHQGDRAVGGLHHGRREVGHGRARRADHRDGRAGDLGQPQGEEPCRALVDPHVQADPTRTVQAQRLEGQRRRARPGGQDHVAHALVDQLGQQGPRQRRRRVHRATTHRPPRPQRRINSGATCRSCSNTHPSSRGEERRGAGARGRGTARA